MSLPVATFSLKVPTTDEDPDGIHVEQEVTVPSNMNQDLEDLEDSNTTIIYNPEDAVKDKKKSIYHHDTRYQNYKMIPYVHLPKMRDQEDKCTVHQ